MMATGQKMNRVSSFLMGILSLVLLLVFHWQDVQRFWTTDAESSGHYYQETFFKEAHRNTHSSLQALNGRRLKTDHNKMIYQFAVPLHGRVYLQPTLIQHSEPYKNLNTLYIELPAKKQMIPLFHGQAQPRQRIDITHYLKDQSLFHVVLAKDSEVEIADRVIGSMEIFVVNDAMASDLPDLPFYLLLWAAPFIGCWFVTRCLDYSPSLALGLNTLHLLLIHILGIMRPELAAWLLVAETLTASGLLLLQACIVARPPPMAPLFWMVLLPGVYLRWQEILIQFTQQLFENPLLRSYYEQGVTMDLFTDRGFFSGLYPQGPLYPLFIKFTGLIFGFSLFHMFYLSLLLSLCLIFITMLLTRKLVGSHWAALAVGLAMSLNPFLIQESTLQRPDVLGACLALTYFYVVFSKLKGSILYGLLRGSVLLGLIWTHLSFAPLALLLLILDVFYQRSQHGNQWKYALRSGAVSLVMLFIAIGPGLYQNWQVYRSFLPESTYYVSRLANYTFSDQPGFPASVDVLRFGKQAPNYQHLSIREYFLTYHTASEIFMASALGGFLIVLDSIGTIWHMSTGENILDVLIYGLSSQQNMLPTVLLLLFEVLIALFLGVFAWLRYRRYRVMLAILALWMLPYTFFHGIFLLKGYANWQFMLDHQILLICVPLLTLITVDALKWLKENQHRWLL